MFETFRKYSICNPLKRSKSSFLRLGSQGLNGSVPSEIILQYFRNFSRFNLQEKYRSDYLCFLRISSFSNSINDEIYSSIMSSETLYTILGFFF
jgi:hypothetical protein